MGRRLYHNRGERIPDKDLLESELGHSVVDTAKKGGWLHYHTFRSEKSPTGFPDYVFVHKGWGRVIFAELKTEKGKVSQNHLTESGRFVVGQDTWLEWLGACPGVEAYCWRPSDFSSGLIARILMAPGEQTQIIVRSPYANAPG